MREILSLHFFARNCVVENSLTDVTSSPTSIGREDVTPKC